MPRGFNAHNRIWNCEKTDSNGELLLEEMEERDLYIVNRDTLTSVGKGGKRHSNLDLCFCSEDLLCIVKHNQLKDTWGSDHYPIEFIIEVSRRIYKKVTNRISTKRTDWRLYEEIIKSKEHILLEEDF